MRSLSGADAPGKAGAQPPAPAKLGFGGSDRLEGSQRHPRDQAHLRFIL